VGRVVTAIYESTKGSRDGIYSYRSIKQDVIWIRGFQLVEDLVNLKIRQDLVNESGSNLKKFLYTKKKRRNNDEVFKYWKLLQRGNGI